MTNYRIATNGKRFRVEEQHGVWRLTWWSPALSSTWDTADRAEYWLETLRACDARLTAETIGPWVGTDHGLPKEPR